jgi:hypothetical protein
LPFYVWELELEPGRVLGSRRTLPPTARDSSAISYQRVKDRCRRGPDVSHVPTNVQVATMPSMRFVVGRQSMDRGGQAEGT